MATSINVSENLENAMTEIMDVMTKQPFPVTFSESDGDPAVSVVAMMSVRLFDAQKPVLSDDTLRSLIETYHTTSKDSRRLVYTSEDDIETMNSIAQEMHDQIKGLKIKGAYAKIGAGWNRRLVMSIAIGWVYENLESIIQEWAREQLKA
jgi:hypothetical protein